MCDVCRLEDIDWEWVNGPQRPQLSPTRLYNVYVGKVAHVEVCHLHAVELFCIGERRFLENHIKMAQELFGNKKRYAHSSFY